jgi:hypothetical protein
VLSDEITSITATPLLDVAAGAPEGFSLGLPDAHFVTLSRRCHARAA